MLTYQAPRHLGRRPHVTPRALAPRVGREQARGHELAGRFRLLQKIGFGGMGEVYLAEDLRTERRCAVKFIRDVHARDAAAVARFRREVQSAGRLCHPNIVGVFDRGTTRDGRAFYAMEFLPGLNLDQLVRRHGPLPASRVVSILRQVCAALTHAHARGLVHGDIKPANLMLTNRGERFDVVKVIDFGLVKSQRGNEALVDDDFPAAFVGSPLYAPPECSAGQSRVDARSDLYSLGATAYFLLTGRPVFEGESALRVIFAHANQTAVDPSELRSNIPASLARIILRCLEKSPSRRFASASELDADLARTGLDAEWTQAAAAGWWDACDTDDGRLPTLSAPAESGSDGIASPAEKTQVPKRSRTAKS